MSSVISKGKSWKGYAEIRHLVVFGASYSAVGYDLAKPHPTKENPLGVPFPGTTYAERNKRENRSEPNWVGWLVSDFAPNPDLLVHDYAVERDGMVDGVIRQVLHQFMPYAGRKPEWASWTQEDALFITWAGINDVAYKSEESYMREKLGKLFEVQTVLYDVGARNFLFIDVPPLHRTPAAGGTEAQREACGSIFTLWNSILREHIDKFVAIRKDVTLMIYSSHAFFTLLFDNPEVYGFREAEVRTRAGRMWVDHIHPTSKIHRLLAQDITSFLNGVGAHQESVL